ncbi:hypothetical protein FQN54_005898 [Arachnomyces sp. PD_36]|nr:hypothetical protein FQN54_005898 [Arachnomyces sp. PD_36]
MALLSMIRIALLGALAGHTVAQSFASLESVFMCYWTQLRATILQNTLYIDGGELWWQQKLSDGTDGQLQNDGNPNGTIYSFDLGISFNKTSNITGLFTDLSKSGGGFASNLAPNYVDGAILSNDNEYILYGGLILGTDSMDPPASDQVVVYEGYQDGANAEVWAPNFSHETLTDDVNRYVAAGASVSAPSENLGFYFSGVRSADWGPITQIEYSANTTSNNLITVDMSSMAEEVWSNKTVSAETAPGRASGELVWIPVSDSGVLVAIGGVINPEDKFRAGLLNDSQIEDSKSTSPGFMETLPIYDIENNNWYSQNTTGDIPGQLAQFCSVVAAASDGSSYNVYIYGGYDGLESSNRASDDVYILSIPSFRWIKAREGSDTQGRRSHRCVKPYPDQMFVIGGRLSADATCVTDGIMRVFNLNDLDFQDDYDPLKWSEYKVPKAVTDVIGGDADGGATETSPENSWDDDELSGIFGKAYAKDIKTYYPYEPTTPGDPSTTDTSTPDGDGGGGGLPLWVGPVIGVLLGLIATSGVIMAWVFFRRRRRTRRSSYGPSEGSQINNRNRVLKWMYGTKVSGHKSDYTTTSTELGGTEKPLPGFRGSDAGRSGVLSPTTPASPRLRTIGEGHQEVDSKQVHEMQASGTAIELPADPPSPKSRHPSDVSSLHDLDSSARLSPSFSPSPPPPETTVTDTEGNTTTASNNRPAHQHHVSFAFSIDDVVSNPDDEDVTLQRPRYISDPPSEDGISDEDQSRRS